MKRMLFMTRTSVTQLIMGTRTVRLRPGRVSIMKLNSMEANITRLNVTKVSITRVNITTPVSIRAVSIRAVSITTRASITKEGNTVRVVTKNTILPSNSQRNAVAGT